MTLSAAINIEEKFSQISALWTPKIIAELNGQHIKAAKIKGAFIWHKHESEDELFQVVKGSMCMEFKNRKIHINRGEMILVPRGVEHRPVAEEETWILLFEPATTVNTGDIIDERTISHLEHI